MPDGIVLDAPSSNTGENVAAIDIGFHIRTFTEYGSTNINADQKSKVIAVAIARAISLHLQLPSSPTISVFAHYADKCGSIVDSLISKINEGCVVDTKLISDLTFKFYKFRYDLVYTPDTIALPFAQLCAVMPDYFPQYLLDMTAGSNTEQNANSFGTLIRNVSFTIKDKIYMDEGKVIGTNVR